MQIGARHRGTLGSYPPQEMGVRDTIYLHVCIAVMAASPGPSVRLVTAYLGIIMIHVYLKRTQKEILKEKGGRGCYTLQK